jgi:hypothetical protein
MMEDDGTMMDDGCNCRLRGLAMSVLLQDLEDLFPSV